MLSLYIRLFPSFLSGGGESLDMVLVGAKADLLDNEQYMKKLHDKGDKYVTTEEGQALADEFDVPFFETSAKVILWSYFSFDRMTEYFIILIYDY